jgi:hypothetical protein
VKAAKKRKTKSKISASATQKRSLNQLATGMPALDNVREIVDFVSPQNVTLKILKTRERDAYDELITPPKDGAPKIVCSK